MLDQIESAIVEIFLIPIKKVEWCCKIPMPYQHVINVF